MLTQLITEMKTGNRANLVNDAYYANDEVTNHNDNYLQTTMSHNESGSGWMEVEDDMLSTPARLVKESRRLNLEEARRAALSNLDQVILSETSNLMITEIPRSRVRYRANRKVQRAAAQTWLQVEDNLAFQQVEWLINPSNLTQPCKLIKLINSTDKIRLKPRIKHTEMLMLRSNHARSS